MKRFRMLSGFALTFALLSSVGLTSTAESETSAADRLLHLHQSQTTHKEWLDHSHGSGLARSPRRDLVNSWRITFKGSKPTQQYDRANDFLDGWDEANTTQTQICHQRKYLEGTYAARVRFTDSPVSGPGGDQIVESFYTISPLKAPMDLDYSELDFEYLPNGGWGIDGPTLYATTWGDF